MEQQILNPARLNAKPNCISTSAISSQAISQNPVSLMTGTELRQRYATSIALLADYAPDKQVTYCEDWKKCLYGNTPSLQLVAEVFGKDVAETWLEIQLFELSEFLVCKEKLSVAQISQTARMIFSVLPHYRLTEFMLFVQRLKWGEYGKFYGAVDPMTILHSLKTFDAHKDPSLGVDEWFDTNGNRRYSESDVIVPNDAPPRPSKGHYWQSGLNPMWVDFI